MAKKRAKIWMWIPGGQFPNLQQHFRGQLPIQQENGCSAPVNKLISTSIGGKIPKIVEYKCNKKCKLQVLYYLNNGTRGYLEKEDTMKYKEFKIFLYVSSTYIFSKYQIYNMFQNFPQFNGILTFVLIIQQTIPSFSLLFVGIRI